MSRPTLKHFGLDESLGLGVNAAALGPSGDGQLLDQILAGEVVIDPGQPKARRRVKVAKGDDGMNKLERAYSLHLADRRHAGEVWDYLFDAANFRLGERCFYKPDFLVFLADGSLEAHEAKGFMEEDALVKIRAFVDKFHVPLVLVRRRKGAWDFERFEAKG